MFSYSILLVCIIFVANSLPFKIFKTHNNGNGKSGTITRAGPTVNTADSTLVLTNVIFRHGNRTPELSELYPTDPYLNYTYFPLGHGQLTNAGKQKEYYIGQQLRTRYDSFLGEYYVPDYLEVRSTNYNRTKMSLQLLLASLFVPHGVEIWNSNFGWQPVPYNYLEKVNDPELMGIECPRYVEAYNEMNDSPEVQAEYNEYREDFDYIAQNSGLNVTSFDDVYDLYFGLSTEEEYGLTLPDWTKSVWPEKIISLSIKQYGMYTRTTELIQMAAGYFLKKLIQDAESKINNPDDEKRMYLYSAHANNLGQLLVSLDIFVTKEIPTYGSYLIFELHYVNSTYGIKIYYQNHNPDEIRLMKLPACEEFCPLENFKSLVSEYLPEDSLCGN